MPINWVGEIIDDLTGTRRDRLIPAWVELIAPKQRQPGEAEDTKRTFPHGFGPADYFRICGPKLAEADPPAEPFRQYNPFTDLFLQRDLPDTYRLSRDKREIITKAIFLPKLACELMREINQLLERSQTPIHNVELALKSLRFEIFQKSAIPFVMAVAEVLIHFGFIEEDEDLRHMYEQFRSLVAYFEDSVVSSPAAATTNKPTKTLKRLRAA